ncbi:MAG: hypothetical protein ABI760_06695 [Ferruginibacter sp.]
MFINAQVVNLQQHSIIMADVHTKEIRSYNMSCIKGKNTKPEMLVRRFLHARNFRYLLHDKKLSGKPDIVLLKFKTIFFVQGSFWHEDTTSNTTRFLRSNGSFPAS